MISVSSLPSDSASNSANTAAKSSFSATNVGGSLSSAETYPVNVTGPVTLSKMLPPPWKPYSTFLMARVRSYSGLRKRTSRSASPRTFTSIKSRNPNVSYWSPYWMSTSK